MRNHVDEESFIERKSGKLRGDVVRTPGNSREGLGLLARMIAQVYLRDKYPGNTSAGVGRTSISKTGDTIQDFQEVQDEARAKEAPEP